MSRNVWYEQPHWTSRLIAEEALMQEMVPSFQLFKSDDGVLKWRGVLSPTGYTEYLVSVTYPPTYPYREPTLRVEVPALAAAAPHVYADGSLCTHRTNWDVQRATAVGEVGLVAAWLVAYETWLRTGEVF